MYANPTFAAVVVLSNVIDPDETVLSGCVAPLAITLTLRASRWSKPVSVDVADPE